MVFRRRRCACPEFAAAAELLEARRLLAVLPLNPPGAFITQPFNPFPVPRAVLGSAKTLEIFATDEDDRIKITVGQMNGANRIRIVVGSKERTVLLRDVRRINITAGFGNDLIQFDDSQGLLFDRRTSLFGEIPDLTNLQFFGNDTIRGTAGRDVIRGGEGTDFIEGLGGADDINGNGNSDTVDGGAGNDVILDSGGSQANPFDFGILYGGAGNDSIIASDRNDTIEGGPGNDTLNGAFGDDYILGGTGNDSLFGWSLADTVFGEEGNDTIFGDRMTVNLDLEPQGDNGNDHLFGGVGNDSIWGEAGNDEIAGGDGSDTLLGHYGEDSISGGEGADYLNGHEDFDEVDGGPGRDLFNLIDLVNPTGQADFSTTRDNPNPRPRQGSNGSETGPIDVLA